MRLCEFMREKLSERGTQAKFARKTRISTGTVSKWAQGGMNRAPNFTNCIRIANYFGIEPRIVFEMAERPDFEKVFIELFPDYKANPAPPADSICPDKNPLHISYYQMLEDIWHIGDQSIGNCIIKIIKEYWPNTANLQASEEKNKLIKEKRAASN
jgi:transcriptional regulator with XRE-family HTH domain